MVVEEKEIHELQKKFMSLLDSLGFSNYESKAYLSLLSYGITDARTICESSGVPTSKIYNIMNKFRFLGLIEIQNSKPIRFRAIDPTIGLIELVKNKEREITKLKKEIPFIENQLNSIYSKQRENEETFFNLEFGLKNFVQKHVIKLTESKKETSVYLELNCLNGIRNYGNEVREKLTNHFIRNDIQNRWIVGTHNRSYLKFFANVLNSHAEYARVTKDIHAPFSIIDNRSVVIVIDNPLVKEGRLASIYIINRDLVKELKQSFEHLWESSKPLAKFI